MTQNLPRVGHSLKPLPWWDAKPPVPSRVARSPARVTILLPQGTRTTAGLTKALLAVLPSFLAVHGALRHDPLRRNAFWLLQAF